MLTAIKKCAIALMQYVIIALISYLVVDALLNSPHKFVYWNQFFRDKKYVFLIIHGFFYVGLYLIWPRIIALHLYVKGLSVENERLNQAINARRYIIGLFVVLELIFQLRPL